MNSENALDAGFANEQQLIEQEKQPARNLLHELRQIVNNSQAPAELGFEAEADHDQIKLSRDGYVISAKVSSAGLMFRREEEAGLSVGISKPGAGNVTASLLAALSSSKPFIDANSAAARIGSLMARIVEDRVF